MKKWIPLLIITSLFLLLYWIDDAYMFVFFIVYMFYGAYEMFALYIPNSSFLRHSTSDQPTIKFVNHQIDVQREKRLKKEHPFIRRVIGAIAFTIGLIQFGVILGVMVPNHNQRIEKEREILSIELEKHQEYIDNLKNVIRNDTLMSNYKKQKILKEWKDFELKLEQD